MSKGKPRYAPAPDIAILARDIVDTLGLDYIDLSKVRFVRSKGTKTRAVARIWGLSRIFQESFGYPPSYVIEVISERYDKLPRDEKEKTILHELLHIPKTFSGALVSHKHFGKPRVTGRIVNKLWKEYRSRKLSSG